MIENLISNFNAFKKLICFFLIAALLQGCTSVVDSGSTLLGLGFASDTTAILFSESWEVTREPSFGFGGGNGTSYQGWELQLVDVRFHKVYWSAQIDHGRRSNQILQAYQWNDSTMLVGLSDEFWFWTIGNKKLQEINFDWKIEKKHYTPGSLSRIRSWKNDFVLLLSYNFGFSPAISGSNPAILDTRTMTVNAWSTGEDAWMADCHDVWWEEESEWVCLMRDENPCRLSLLSGSGDTLSSVTYAHECKKLVITHFYRYFIRASLGGCNPQASKCYTYPMAVEKGEISSAMFRHDKYGNIAQKPSFWMYYGDEMIGIKFVDSLGNVARY
jgi:hypothetical protein